MTVADQITGPHSLEYLLCVEGIGWPSDLDDLSATWLGTVITSADINGDLATVLNCTVKAGLTPPDAISDSLDPTTMEFKPGAADFRIDNLGLWLDDVLRPRQTLEQSGTYYGGALMADLSYDGAVIDIDQDNPGGAVHEFVEDDIVWLGGREAVLLGSKAAQGAGHRFTGCKRARLGTPQGGWDPNNAWHGQHTFPEDTIVYPWNPFWFNRRVILFAHVPGEVRANCVRLFNGRITGYVRVEHGAAWALAATALMFPGKRRKHTRLPLKVVEYLGAGVGAYGGTLNAEVHLSADDSRADTMRDYAAHYLYRYREVPGGAELPSVDEETPQSETATIETTYGSETVAISQTLIAAGGKYIRLLHHSPQTNALVTELRVDPDPLAEAFGITLVEGSLMEGEPAHNLLDNLLPAAGANRFTVNGTVRRNVIDVALILLTSCDSEFWRGDAAAGGTTTVVNFAAVHTEDQWIGYALFCVEGDNKGEARLITDNDASSITVDTPFSAATHSGNEYQVRNSIYDVLPIGWGLQVHNSEIDVDSFETVRDHYLPNAEVGFFVLGEDADTDYWELLVENIFRPYGVLAYVARANGKLSARFIYALTSDAAFETLITINDGDLLEGSFSEVDILPREPVSRIEIYTRSEVVPGVGKETDAPLVIAAGDAELSYDTMTPDVLEIRALLNDAASIGDLAALHTPRLLSLYSPPYEAGCALTGASMLTVQAGAVLSVTTTRSGVKDPDDGSDGLSSTPCRVLSSVLVLDPRGLFAVECGVQLLRAISSARIAPAADLTNIVTAGDPDYFAVDLDAFVDEASGYTVTDFMLFAVGDRIAHRAKDGSVTGGPYVIESFGTNEVSDPTAANSNRINTVGAIADAFTAGDYVTFYAWDASATANMELYSAYADATDEELGAGDSPKEYL